jgi:hemoglobin/transferrin/lactoferrin receptor protein
MKSKKQMDRVMRYSTINQEQSIALNLNYASKKFAALTLVSFNDFEI